MCFEWNSGSPGDVFSQTALEFDQLRELRNNLRVRICKPLIELEIASG